MGESTVSMDNTIVSIKKNAIVFFILSAPLLSVYE